MFYCCDSTKQLLQVGQIIEFEDQQKTIVKIEDPKYYFDTEIADSKIGSVIFQTKSLKCIGIVYKDHFKVISADQFPDIPEIHKRLYE